MKRLLVSGLIIPLILTLYIVTSSHCQESDASGLPVVNQTVTTADAVDIALRNNPTIDARRAMVQAAAARTAMARSMTGLQASVTGFATKATMPMILAGPENVEPSNITMAPDDSRLDLNMMAMYPLYTGGRLREQVNAAKSIENATSFENAAVELEVALMVKTAYYRALLARMYVDAFRQRVDEAQERLRIAEEAFKEGRIAKYDLLRNQTDLAEAQQMLVSAQNEVQQALIDLKNAMGVSQTSQIDLTGELTLEDQAHALEELQSTALAQRPEVAAARARARAAQSSISVAQSAYRPQVYATAMKEVESVRSDGSNSGYLIGVTAALPVFDSGRRKSAVDEAQAMLRQMQAEERDVASNTAREVASAYADIEAAAKNVSLSRAAIEQAEEDYRVIRLRYEAGKATNVEVLDALASLTRAQTNYAEALFAHNVARERLARAIGQK